MFNKLLLILCTVYLNANDSEKYSLDARLLWISFECSNYAAAKGDDKETQRLFQVGYKSGISFLNAIKNNKIKSEDLNKYVPIGLKFTLRGPNNDFAIGRLYQKLYEESLYLFRDEKGKNLAITKYNQSNCQLVGVK